MWHCHKQADTASCSGHAIQHVESLLATIVETLNNPAPQELLVLKPLAYNMLVPKSELNCRAPADDDKCTSPVSMHCTCVAAHALRMTVHCTQNQYTLYPFMNIQHSTQKWYCHIIKNIRVMHMASSNLTNASAIKERQKGKQRLVKATETAYIAALHSALQHCLSLACNAMQT